MTTRHSGYLVVLADDIRDDDAEATLNALRMVRGVVAVQPHETTADMMIAVARADDVWRARILALLQDCRRG